MAKEHDRNPADEKEKLINFTLTSIEKQYGKGAVMRLKGDEAAFGSVPVIPSGSVSLDIALGVGGYPKGRIVEIYGHEASGKTTLALHAIAESQKRGGIAVFIDAEHALDVNYAKRLGIQTDDLLIAQPDYGEQALDMVESLVKSNSIDIIVVDSVAALVPKAELEGEMGESHVGLQARLMSQALRKLAGAISRSKTCVFFINQIRMKIGVMFGNPETTTGGNALKFYATMRLDVRRSSAIKENDALVGSQIVVKVVKNKLSPPFKEARFDILFGTGINRLGELLDLGTEHGIIEKSGAWLSFGGERLGQGRENSRKTLAENPEILSAVEKKIFEKFSLVYS